MSNVFCARRNDLDGIWTQVHNVNGGVGVTLSWEQLGTILRDNGTMRSDEHLAKVRVDAQGASFYFETNE